MSIKKIRLATRQSKLAMWQANFVATQLKKNWPNLEIELIGFTTQGDKILDKSLSKIGGKGLFIKELEQALLENKADIAVHSVKDMPAILDQDFSIAAVCQRATPWDAILGKYTVKTLPQHAIVGTSSLRRASQLKLIRPDIIVKELRGNVDTRIKKLEAGEFDAIILAAAGLERLNLAHHITEIIDPKLMLPACGQGAIGIECLAHKPDLIKLLRPLNHQPTMLAVTAERALNAKLGGSCDSAIAIHANIINNKLTLQAKILDPDGIKCIEAQHTIPLKPFWTGDSKH